MYQNLSIQSHARSLLVTDKRNLREMCKKLREMYEEEIRHDKIVGISTKVKTTESEISSDIYSASLNSLK